MPPPKFYSPLLADLAIALAAHILTSGSVGIIDSPGTDSSFSSEDFLPEVFGMDMFYIDFN